MTRVVTEWVAHSPANTVDKRVRWRGLTRIPYSLRGYKGVATRQVRTVDENGTVKRRVQQYERCGCFHTKRHAAAKCSVWLANKLNKEPDLIDPKNRLEDS